jgi:hypothetical protein
VGLPHNRLHLVGSLMGLEVPYGGVSAQLRRIVGLLLLSFAHSWNTNSALCFLLYFEYFHLFPGMCPAKHVSPITSGTRSKYMHMCQSLFISLVFGL